MKVGDRVRVKTFDLEPYFQKGLQGEIVEIEEYSDYLKIKFDDGDYYKSSLVEFKAYFELITLEKKVICPVALVNWYKACTPYIGGNNG